MSEDATRPLTAEEQIALMRVKGQPVWSSMPTPGKFIAIPPRIIHVDSIASAEYDPAKALLRLNLAGGEVFLLHDDAADDAKAVLEANTVMRFGPSSTVAPMTPRTGDGDE